MADRFRLGPRSWAVIGAVGLVLIIGSRFEFLHHLEVDACLDAGGRWGDAIDECDFRTLEEIRASDRARVDSRTGD